MISTLLTIYPFLCFCSHLSLGPLHSVVISISLKEVLWLVSSVPSPSQEFMMSLFTLEFIFHCAKQNKLHF